MTKLKITELTEEKTFYHRDRDAFGNRTAEPYQAAVKRKVQTVQGWKRFGHYLIDLIILYAINFLIGLVFALIDPYTANTVPDLTWNLVSMLVTAIYYFGIEYAIGTSIGKLVTNSVVIDEYGDKPDGSTLLGRSFARIIPFEAFSCLGERGWHDTLSKTYVVTKTERDILHKLLEEQSGKIRVDDRHDILD
jgi:uncharacterized RDD family membrane protein YckC